MSSSQLRRLHATCPLEDDSRYCSVKRSQPTHLAMDLGTDASPTYLSPYWLSYVQPEGKPYFSHMGQMTTVTESWVYDPKIVSEVEKWIECITILVKKKKTDLNGLDLYIRLDEVMDCFYYVVDRQAQALFWIEDLSTEDVGLPPVVSPSHLRTALEKEFWQHTDRFPAHFGGLPEESLLKLLDTFAYIRLDQITSSYSTFTHSAAETQAIYDVLERCRGRTHEPEVVSTIARGWDAILFSRFHNLYGEETPRIDSRRSVYVDQEREEEKYGYGARMMRLFTFTQSDCFREEMNALFVDQFVYSSRVSDFVQERVQEWKEQVMPSLLMLLLHIPFFFSRASGVAAGVSAMCFSVSLVAALVLVQQHSRLSHCKDPEEVIDWFSSRALRKHKFQRAAFIFAFPSAFFNWGIISFFCHWLFIVLSQIRLTVAIPLVGVVGVVCFFCFLQITATSKTALASPVPQTSPQEFDSARVTEDMV